jgi:glycine cleavage system H protein
MVIVLVILTLIVCLGIDVVRSRRLRAAADARTAGQSLPSATAILERFFHPGHAWALVEDSSTVRVGMDEVARNFIGSVDGIETAPKGSEVRQGEPLARLRHGSRILTLAAPLSGVLIEANPLAADRPSLLSASPFEKGWIARIAPTNLAQEMHNLLRGALADRWRDAVRAQLAGCFAPKMGLVLQDGGQLADNFGDLLSDPEWQELADKLFPVESSEQSKSQTHEGQIP